MTQKKTARVADVLLLSAVPPILVAIVFGLVAFSRVMHTKYDQNDPDFGWLSKRLEELDKELDRRLLSTANLKIDFAKLAGGNWKTVCMIGGYGNPIEIMTEHGGTISSTDRERLIDKKSGLRLATVEEFKFMVAYIRPDGVSHFIHFPSGLGPTGQHYVKCIDKPRTEIDLGDE